VTRFEVKAGRALAGRSTKEATMAFRVYSGPHGADGFRAVEKDRMLFKELSSLDEAMSWARHLDTTGHTALLIEGDDGSRLDKREIVAALRHCETEPSGAGQPV
jgi:hypothetical protein